MTNLLTTLAEVANVKLERPANAGSDWKGVSHIDLLRGIQDALQKSNYHPRLLPGTYVLSRGGADLTATFPVDLSNKFIGVVSSNASRKSLEFFIGIMVDKHTPLVSFQFGGLTQHPSWEYVTSFRLQDVCEEAVCIFDLNLHTAEDRFHELHELTLNESTVRSILFETAARGWSSFSRLGPIWRYWRSIKGTTGLDLLRAFGAHWNCARPTQRLELLRRISELISQKKKITHGQVHHSAK